MKVTMQSTKATSNLKVRLVPKTGAVLDITEADEAYNMAVGEYGQMGVCLSPVGVSGINCALGMVGARFSGDMWYGDGEIRWEIYIDGIKTPYVATSSGNDSSYEGWLESVIGPASNYRLRGNYSGGGCWFVNTVDEQIIVELKPTIKVNPGEFNNNVNTGGLTASDAVSLQYGEGYFDPSISLTTDDFMDSNGNISLCINPYDPGIGNFYSSGGGTYRFENGINAYFNVWVDNGNIDPKNITVRHTGNSSVNVTLQSYEENSAYYKLEMSEMDGAGVDFSVTLTYSYKGNTYDTTMYFTVYRGYGFTIEMDKYWFAGSSAVITDASAKPTVEGGPIYNVRLSSIENDVNGNLYKSTYWTDGWSVFNTELRTGAITAPGVIKLIWSAYDRNYNSMTYVQEIELIKVTYGALIRPPLGENDSENTYYTHTPYYLPVLINDLPGEEFDQSKLEGITFIASAEVRSSSNYYEGDYYSISDELFKPGFVLTAYNRTSDNGFYYYLAIVKNGNTLSRGGKGPIGYVTARIGKIENIVWDKTVYNDEDTIATLTGKVDDMGNYDDGLVYITRVGYEEPLADARMDAEGNFEVAFNIDDCGVSIDYNELTIRAHYKLGTHHGNLAFMATNVKVPIRTYSDYEITGPVTVRSEYTSSDIDWGDGATYAANSGTPEHTYGSGVFTMRVWNPAGTLSPVYIRNSNGYTLENTALTAIKRFGRIGKLPRLSYCNGIATVPSSIPVTVREMNSFLANSGSNPTGISTWDLSRIETATSAFSNTSAFNQDLSNTKLNPCANINYLLDGAVAFNNPLPRMFMNYSNGVFNNAKLFDQDISDWGYVGAANDTGMFNNCPIRDEYKPVLGNAVDFYDVSDVDFAWGVDELGSVIYEPISGLTELRDYLFVNPTSPVRPYTIRKLSNDIERIGKYVFTNIYTLTIPGTVKVIDTGAVVKTYNDTTIIMEEGVEELKDYAFLTDNTTFTLPSTIKRIGKYAIVVKDQNITVPAGVEEMHAQSFISKNGTNWLYLTFVTATPPIIHGDFGKVMFYVNDEYLENYRSNPKFKGTYINGTLVD